MYDGDVPLERDEDEVRERVRELREADVDAVAICLLHSYLNPEHELRARLQVQTTVTLLQPRALPRTAYKTALVHVRDGGP